MPQMKAIKNVSGGARGTAESRAAQARRRVRGGLRDPGVGEGERSAGLAQAAASQQDQTYSLLLGVLEMGLPWGY